MAEIAANLETHLLRGIVAFPWGLLVVEECSQRLCNLGRQAVVSRIADDPKVSGPVGRVREHLGCIQNVFEALLRHAWGAPVRVQIFREGC